MKRILIIHPKDFTTDFLSRSYLKLSNNNNFELFIINDPNISKSKLKEIIKGSDIIIMLGHGTEYGLLCDYGGRKFSRLLINSEYVYELRNKLNIGVWCNANIFFEKYNIPGFSTGMFISEPEEALDCCISCNSNEIEQACFLFTELFRDSLKKLLNNENLFEVFKELEKNYIEENNKVVEFNRSGFLLSR